MRNKLKSIGVILFSLGFSILLTFVFNSISLKITSYMKVKDNVVTVDDLHEGSLYKLTNIKKEKDYITISFKLSEPIGLTINYLKYKHEIYIDNKLVSQNIDESLGKYDNKYAYKSFVLEEDSIVTVKGKGVSATTHFIADEVTMDNHIQARTFIYSMYFICFFIIAVVNIIMFLNNRKQIHFLCMAITSIFVMFKVVIKGDLYFLIEMFGITIQNQYYLNILTGVIWTYFPVFAIAFFFKITISKKINYILAAIFILMLGLGFIGEYGYTYNIIVGLIIPFYLYILYFGIVNKKRMYIWVIVADIIIGASSFYKGGISSGYFPSGDVNFVTYIPATGQLVFIIIFLGIFLYSHFEEVHRLKDNQLQFERIKLLRGIGHDLKLPLSVIKSSNQIISKYDMSKEDRQDYLGTGLVAINELELMVQNISSYISNNKIKTNIKEEISVKESFQNLDKQFSIYKDNKDYYFKLVKYTKDAIINITYSNFYRLIFNLVNNAFKYTNEGGTITVSYEIFDKVYIYVEDTGIGMSASEIQKIFEPFYRADNARTKEGLGIGLSVVKNILDNAKAEIKVSSVVNEGTKIILIFDKK